MTHDTCSYLFAKAKRRKETILGKSAVDFGAVARARWQPEYPTAWGSKRRTSQEDKEIHSLAI
jgi:hypothetical protein